MPGARAVIRVPDTHAARAIVAAAMLGFPGHRMSLVGITGTNGKTTTSYLAESILSAAGHPVGVVGTVEYRYGDVRRSAPLTTPGAEQLQGLLAEMATSGTTHAVLEVSSHALHQSRVAGCRFAVGAFLNLTQDHLDYHGSMEAYFDAKALLFEDRGPAGAPGDAVINLDDAWGVDLVTRAASRVLTFAARPTVAGDAVGPSREADVWVTERALSRSGTRARLSTPRGPIEIESPLVGHHNLENLVAATAIGLALGLDTEVIVRGLASASRVPGRLERVTPPPGVDVDVLVDYAHTPDALARALEAVRPIAHRRVITVFGCGGDRDRRKRPLMGSAALHLSDLVVVTSDNPRTEDPGAIIAEILPGLADGRRVEPDALGRAGRRSYAVVADRRAAITCAIDTAEPGDLVLIAGKGHEDYQIVGTTKHHFDDREEAARALEARATGARSLAPPSSASPTSSPAPAACASAASPSGSPRSRPTPARWERASSSGRSRDPRSTATTSSRRRSRAAPPARWWRPATSSSGRRRASPSRC
ncbi:MAG: UDP-N-acetylmuramoyl-L-alanyl-D-glutamate--2,6-diaminopimelate ligase [Deltaproteobacteria bacterium]|nr:UDP-N-acetylmuramoyl-L-alanyl-D-glutamate--2,6-diaminopimelate ligase [Deltaproteobacteria bacterium]